MASFKPMNADVGPAVSKNLGALLKKKKLTYRSAGELCGVSYTTIFNAVTLQQTISLAVAVRICNGFKITISQLIKP